MSANTSIEWTDRSWNPVRGCSIVSPGCVNCYAMKQAHRFSGAGRPYEGLTKLTKAGPQWTGVVRPVEDALLEPLSWRTPQRVFVNSMSDLFHEDVPDGFIDRVFAVMALAPRHTFQILTKRAERMRKYVTTKHCLWNAIPDFVGPTISTHDGVEAWCMEQGVRRSERERRIGIINNGGGFTYPAGDAWPLKNVWLGVSVENQHFADERIPLLLQTPAAVRFISAEPLLGAVDLSKFLTAGDSANPTRALNTHGKTGSEATSADTSGPANAEAVAKNVRAIRQEAERPAVRKTLDWVIVGGESGPGARPFDLACGRSIVQQCKAAGVACFVKQLGAKPNYQRPRAALAAAGGVECRHGYDVCPKCDAGTVPLRDKKGGDPSEWPEDLRVRQMPGAIA